VVPGELLKVPQIKRERYMAGRLISSALLGLTERNLIRNEIPGTTQKKSEFAIAPRRPI
jgi:hypothetical protein